MRVPERQLRDVDLSVHGYSSFSSSPACDRVGGTGDDRIFPAACGCIPLFRSGYPFLVRKDDVVPSPSRSGLNTFIVISLLTLRRHGLRPTFRVRVRNPELLAAPVRPPRICPAVHLQSRSVWHRHRPAGNGTPVSLRRTSANIMLGTPVRVTSRSLRGPGLLVPHSPETNYRRADGQSDVQDVRCGDGERREDLDVNVLGIDGTAQGAPGNEEGRDEVTGATARLTRIRLWPGPIQPLGPPVQTLGPDRFRLWSRSRLWS